jgi:ankyrin repeat protein
MYVLNILNIGATPLHMAADAGNAEFVTWAMATGADPELKDNGGLLAVDLAKNAGHKDVVAILNPGGNRGGRCGPLCI